ncbi:MAG: hypothetical protein CVU65_13910 [Deltaproteobacteria bacterium HGW-Deltaproteobacteria-22]|nr:MAG: hypothetical protein CVU65_13910 [Deltaproteobacteria bacterium HGW-Deltaproteobacteria-22]
MRSDSMILGMGTDLVSFDVFREAVTSESHSGILLSVFTDGERSDAQAGPVPEWERLAARFAAKEACVKALRSALAMRASPVAEPQLAEIEVVRFASGAPVLELHGQAKAIADLLGVTQTWVSLSHDKEYAMATVILEGEPGKVQS